MDIPSPWRLTDTPDPDEYGFVTLHDPDSIAWFTTSGNDGRPLKEVTLYKNWKLKEPRRATDDLWGNYVFTSKSVGEGGVIIYHWGKNKTEAEKNTPYETFTKVGNHYWHPILKQVRFFADRNFPLSTNGPDGGIILAARLYDRIVHIPSMSEGTLFQHDLFFSATKFQIGQYPTPSPASVSWNYHGSTGSFPECLHPKLVFPPVRTAFAAYSTGGGAVAAFGSANGQVFPATNFEDWQPYVIRDDQEEVEGGWKRVRITVFPPDIPEFILR